MSSGPFPVLNAAGTGHSRDPGYRWDNATRPQSDCCVIQRTLAGAGEFTMAGQTTLVRRDHAMLFSHQEASAYGYPAGAAEPYAFCFLAFFPAGLRPFFDEIRRQFGSVIPMHAEGEAARLLNVIVEKARETAFADVTELAESIFRLLTAVYREQVNSKQSDDPIAYGYHLLNDHAGGRLGLKEIARLAGVSREYFIRGYARRYGRTPGAVLRGLRLDRARALVLTTAQPLDAIAAACGFGGADALRRSFRQRHGVNPLTLRHGVSPTAVRS